MALWAGLCLVISVVLRRQVFILCILALLMWCVVPGIATPFVNGYASRFADVHPASVLMLTIMFVQVLVGSAELGAALARRTGWAAFAVALVIAASVMGFIGRGLSFASATINELVAPLSLFFLLGGCALVRPQRVRTIRRALLAIAAGESLFAIAQTVFARPLLWAQYYSRQPWFLTGYNRWMGTFDNPLILSVLLASGVFLLAEIRRWWFSLVLLLVFFGGLLITQSRVGLLVAGVGSIYLLIRGRTSGAGKFALLVVGVTIGVVAYRRGAGASVAARVANDQGSAAVRQQALTYFIDHWGEFVWWGRGLGSSFEVSRDAGLPSSFESAILMYSIDLGVVAALVYFALMLSIVYWAVRDSAAPGSAAAAAAAIVMIQTFSALSGTTTIPPILWALLALAASSSPAREDSDRVDTVLTASPSLRVP